MNFFNTRAVNLLFGYGLLLSAALVLNALFLSEYYSTETGYQDVELVHDQSKKIVLSNYAIKTKDQILLAANTPEELGLVFRFKQSATLSIKIQPLYPAHICGRTGPGIDQAELSLKSVKRDYLFPIRLSNQETLSLDVFAGETLDVSLQNNVVNNCGRANLVFEVTNPDLSSILFIWCLAWAILIFVCWWCRSSMLLIGIALGLNVVLVWADTTLGKIGYQTLMFNTALSWLLTAFMLLSSLYLKRSWVISILVALLLITAFSVPMTFVINLLVFGKPVEMDTIYAILQSYLSQIIEFWGAFLGLRAALAFAVITLFFIIISYLFRSAHNHKFKTFVITSLLIVISSIAAASSIYGSHTYRLVDNSFDAYKREINKLRSISAKRNVNEIDARLNSAFNKNTTVIVIGESVNKNNLSAYSYIRKTTPLLDQRIQSGEVIRFDNAYSNHTHSNPSLSFMLTGANQYKRNNWLESPSILNVARAANLPTTWLSNHRMASGWSNHITTIAKEADKTRTINYKIGVGNISSNYDGKLLPMFATEIDKQPEQLMFLHFYNSHVNYCNRFPRSIERISNQINPLNFGELYHTRLASNHWVSCYDRSIKYTDLLLEQAIQILEKKENPAVLVYLSDHSEEVFSGRGHNSSVFTNAMVSIPLVVWANDAWKSQHSDVWQALQKNAQQVFTNDRLFELVVDLSGIESNTIDDKHTLSSTSYHPPEIPYTLHRAVKLNKPDHWQYWQGVNMATLVSHTTDNPLRLQAMNINSLGKASYASFLGIKEFSFTVELNESNAYQIANQHDPNAPLALTSLLDGLELESLSCINLDISSKASVEGIAKANEDLLERYDFAFCDQKNSTTLSLYSPDFFESLTSLKYNTLLQLNLRSIYDAPRPN